MEVKTASAGNSREMQGIRKGEEEEGRGEEREEEEDEGRKEEMFSF